ncbi:MAG: hypothetical protein Q7R34_13940, partial [Dehalococcoidia bacterium]|nr:hypothetical protein [Dehalococcoidia bacterium]
KYRAALSHIANSLTYALLGFQPLCDLSPSSCGYFYRYTVFLFEPIGDSYPYITQPAIGIDVYLPLFLAAATTLAQATSSGLSADAAVAD